MRIAITYPMTAGRSFRCVLCSSSPSFAGEDRCAYRAYASRSALNKSHFPMINVTKPQVSCLLLDRKEGYSVAS